MDILRHTIKQLRKSSGYTLKQFATKIGITVDQMREIEKTGYVSNLELLRKISSTLNVTIGVLYGCNSKHFFDDL